MICAAVLLAAAGPVQASLITISADNTNSAAPGGAGGQSIFDLDADDHPITAIGSGGSATTTSNYSGPNATSAVLKWTMSHIHSGAGGLWVNSFMQTRFTANRDSLTYKIAGQYSVRALDNIAPNVASRVQLFDVTPGLELGLFDTQKASRNSLNVEYIIGGQGGDQLNNASGSLTGLPDTRASVSVAFLG